MVIKMSKILPLAFHNLKKDKKQYFSVGIIILLTALILNLALVLTFSIDSAYDAKSVELNSSDVDVIVPKIMDSQELTKEIKASKDVENIEKRNAILLSSAIIKEFRGEDFDTNIVFYNKDDSHEMNSLESMEQSDEKYDAPIYLPLYIAEFGGFGIGDEITFKTNKNNYTFQIAGIVQEMQYGNCSAGTIGVYLPDDIYREFAEKNTENQVVCYSVETSESADVKSVLNELGEIAEENNASIVFSSTVESKKQARTMVCNLLIVILLTFALIVLLVSMFLCKFRIQNTIEEEMSNMGVLKALGFTSNMIIASVVLPYVAVGIIASAIGTALSYLLLPTLVNMLALQAGFRFDVGFSAAAMLIAICVLTAITIIFTYLAARRIRKLHPILAIRGENEKGKVRRNHFAIDKTPGNIQIILMLKQMAASARQNSLLFFVLFVMTVMISFSGNLFYNVIIESDNFMSTLSEETPSVIFQTSVSETDKVKSALNKNNDVANVLKYTSSSVKVGSENATAFICEDFSQTTNDLCYEGRNPESRNEIAVGNSIAEVENCKIGDKIKVSDGENEYTYKIVGFIQSINYQGEVCALTNEGFKQLNENYEFGTLYVYLNHGVDAEKFISAEEDNFPTEIVKSMNSAQMKETTQEMFSLIVNIIIAAIFLLTMLIVLLILFIIIKSMIVQRKQEFGIYKAIGYSGIQLILQVAGSFMPVSILAVTSSALLGYFYVPAMNDVMFGMIGAMKNNLEVPVGILILFATVEIILTFVISMALAAPIKKITAYSLIKE